MKNYRKIFSWNVNALKNNLQEGSSMPKKSKLSLSSLIVLKFRNFEVEYIPVKSLNSIVKNFVFTHGKKFCVAAAH